MIPKIKKHFQKHVLVPHTIMIFFFFFILFLHFNFFYYCILSFFFLTLKVPEKLKLYGLYVYYVVHICDFGMLRVKLMMMCQSFLIPSTLCLCWVILISNYVVFFSYTQSEKTDWFMNYSRLCIQIVWSLKLADDCCQFKDHLILIHPSKSF